MRRLMMSIAVFVLLAASTPWSGASQSGLFCTLTGKKIATCCCELKDGKLYCPPAKKTIESCCCKLKG
jgi:hypothetical protein